ncbi:arylalkylamine N-acetyltransferase 1-like isoform X1 [Leptopilina boulardi]|uniref:arylalkylamine N-acetyltransferase 1-like isoform X1 n=1 Tax=Leptopilina boulardi TaxID=63433 RepID=UPI0021F635DD|nr:arylalkylamine N-acetyltransferase 1-like isoform X1 [Leptopilina boulardi]
MSNENLTIVVIQENRFPDVINHLRYNFFADEPLNKAVGLCQPGDSHYELEQHCLQTLKQGYSRMLIDNKGTIAGTVLNGIVQRGEREEAERRLAEMNDKKFQTIFGLLYKVNEKIDLFSKYNVDDLFECRILSVDDRYRGRGLANVLVKESLETAKNAGFKHALQIKYAWDDFHYAKMLFINNNFIKDLIIQKKSLVMLSDLQDRCNWIIFTKSLSQIWIQDGG